MKVARMGPMVVVPADEEIDLELTRRRLKEEKSLAGPVTVAELGQEVLGDATKEQTRQGFDRFVQFLAKQKPTEEKSHVTPLKSKGARQNPLRTKAINIYLYISEFEERMALKGFQLDLTK